MTAILLPADFIKKSFLLALVLACGCLPKKNHSELKNKQKKEEKYQTLAVKKKHQNEKLSDYLKKEKHRKPYLATFGDNGEIIIGGLKVPKGAKGKYVMDGYGTIYMDIENLKRQREKGGKLEKFPPTLQKHTSFLAGGKVASAGEWESSEEGTLLWIDNKSGHYRPRDSHAYSFLKELQSRGLEKVKIRQFIHSEAKRMERLLKDMGITTKKQLLKQDGILLTTSSYREHKEKIDALSEKSLDFDDTKDLGHGETWIQFNKQNNITDFKTMHLAEFCFE